jgi:caffeoyl-CoA O-methyltransferase
MFHNIPPAIQARMTHLEQIDARDRHDGSPITKRLRQIPVETGKLIAILAATAPDGALIEIGTSAGYSAMWLALACLQTGRRLTTFEVLDGKIALATETFSQTGIDDVVTLVHGDARRLLVDKQEIAFCFLDADKETYDGCYDVVVPNLVSGGLIAADNVISHQEALQPLVDKALADNRVDAVVVPIGKGLLLCRKI